MLPSIGTVFFDFLKEAPITENYLLAIGEAHNTLHDCILINDTDDPIDVFVERPPVLKILQGAGTPELIESIRRGKTESFIHGPVLPRSSAYLRIRYFDWEFDFSNKKYLFLKTRNQQLLLGFFMDKYCVCDKKQPIPFGAEEGWLFPGKVILQRVVTDGGE
jgi:hypothetical protein